jgi:type II secretory pathway pseudopilin PulG
MNDSTQTGVAMALIAAVCTIAGYVVGWLKDRDKLRYGEEICALKAQNTVQQSQIEANATALVECKEAHDACKDMQQATNERLSGIEQALTTKKDKSDHVPPFKPGVNHS